ncbi:MAG TPA: hypothetical protein VF100_12360, partial [Thermoanaerobaculia bacterium]
MSTAESTAAPPPTPFDAETVRHQVREAYGRIGSGQATSTCCSPAAEAAAPSCGCGSPAADDFAAAIG